MKHRVAGRRLDRTTEHRTAMFRNMVTSLLRHERIVTTTPKAKELRRIADRIITLGKKGSPHARRIALRQVRDAEVVAKLFGPLARRFEPRPGGYTRVVRVGRRAGDNAELSVIELVDRSPAPETEKRGEGREAGPEKKAKPAKAAKKEAEGSKAEKAKKPTRAKKERPAPKK